MRYLKRFNESIQKKDLQETIDEVLDSLNKKSKLSKSEKEFMDEVSKGNVISVTTPKPSGNFWADMANPHNLSTMWQGKDQDWHQLKNLEDEQEEEDEKEEDDNKRWHNRNNRIILNYGEKYPELKSILNDYLKMSIKHQEECAPLVKKLRFLGKSDYNLGQKIDYSLKSMDSLFNQFGPLLDIEIDENGEYKPKNPS